MDQRADAVVIGAGVIGASIGHELARRGWSTLNVDALASAGAGSTGSSSAIVRFTYSTRAGVAMSWEGMHAWAEWPDHVAAGVAPDRPLAEFVRCGTIVFLHEGGHHEAFLGHFDDLGIPHEHWDAERVAERLPGVDMGRYGPPRRPDDEHFFDDAVATLPGAVWIPDGGYVTDPQLAARNLQHAAEGHGGRFAFNTRVVEVVRDDGGDRVRGVRLDDGSMVVAPVVVNAAGPASGHVNELAGLADSMNIGTRPLRVEVHQVPAPASLDWPHTGAHLADTDVGVYVRPAHAGSAMLVGSTDPDCDEREWVDDVDDVDRTVTADQWRAQVWRLARRFPDLGVPNQPRGVADLYDVADDWIPIYDRTDLDGFYVAIGTSGNQFKNAAVAGHCMAELITAVSAGHDHDADPVIVAGRRTGMAIDMATFARNREINRDSSFSVNG